MVNFHALHECSLDMKLRSPLSRIPSGFILGEGEDIDGASTNLNDETPRTYSTLNTNSTVGVSGRERNLNSDPKIQITPTDLSCKEVNDEGLSTSLSMVSSTALETFDVRSSNTLSQSALTSAISAGNSLVNRNLDSFSIGKLHNDSNSLSETNDYSISTHTSFIPEMPASQV